MYLCIMTAQGSWDLMIIMIMDAMGHGQKGFVCKKQCRTARRLNAEPEKEAQASQGSWLAGSSRSLVTWTT